MYEAALRIKSKKDKKKKGCLAVILKALPEGTSAELKEGSVLSTEAVSRPTIPAKYGII